MEKEVEKEMKSFLQRLMSSLKRKGQFQYSYTFKDNSLLIYETRIRDAALGTDQKMPIARINYIESRDVWKIYIRHGRMNWDVYKPQPETKKLSEVLKILEEDKYSLFFG